jgi:hypothetical protein
MFTTTRVSVGTAFGPGNISALAAGDGEGEPEGEAAGEVEGGGVALTRGVFWLLLGSTVQPVTRNTNNIKISRDRFISFAPLQSVEQRAFLEFLFKQSVSLA